MDGTYYERFIYTIVVYFTAYVQSHKHYLKKFECKRHKIIICVCWFFFKGLDVLKYFNYIFKIFCNIKMKDLIVF